MLLTPAARPWYATWFEHAAYDLVYARRDEKEARRAIDLIERVVAPPPAAHMLDVACGRGRHAVELARRGYAVTGLDLSARALRAARRRATKAGVDVAFVQQDMRTPFCTGCADVVVNLFTAFGYFHHEADHLKALCAMTQALRPGGRLVQDFLNAPYVERHLVPFSTRVEANVEITEHRWIADGRVEKRVELRRADGATHTFRESVRLFTRADFEQMYEACGLRLVHAYGDYDGQAYGDDTPRLLLVAART